MHLHLAAPAEVLIRKRAPTVSAPVSILGADLHLGAFNDSDSLGADQHLGAVLCGRRRADTSARRRGVGAAPRRRASGASLKQHYVISNMSHVLLRRHEQTRNAMFQGQQAWSLYLCP